MINKIILSLIIFSFINSNAFAAYQNNLRTTFLNNKTNICCINIRNFNSKDINNNGLIDENEEKGNFLNAIKRLDEIKNFIVSNVVKMMKEYLRMKQVITKRCFAKLILA